MKKTLKTTAGILMCCLVLLAVPASGLCNTLLYEDDFSDPASGWPRGENEEIGKLDYTDGKYAVRTNKPWPSMVFGNPEIILNDIDLEVTATQMVAPANNNNAYGVLCRYTEYEKPFSAYAFLVSGDGYWSILKIADKKIEALMYWAFSSAIRQGNDTNVLRVIASGTSLHFSVNGVYLGGVTDYRLLYGDIALVSISYEDKPVEVHFDDLKIYSPY
ncbi:MAG: hypothetical protein JRI83_13390 [Deltaproteobacteria bacterium]|nr:hypothetical protein [Deltaproteobacteria bacterium]